MIMYCIFTIWHYIVLLNVFTVQRYCHHYKILTFAIYTVDLITLCMYASAYVRMYIRTYMCVYMCIQTYLRTVPPRCNVPHATRALYTRECTRTSMHSRVFHSRVCTYSRVSHSRVYPYSRVLRSRVYTHILQVSLAYRVCIHT